MGVGRDMTWARYTQDDGTFRSVRIDKALLDAGAVLGFAARNAADKYLPARQMRYIYVVDPLSGQRRKLHVGSVAATLWTGAVASIDFPRVGEADPVTYARGIKRGEKILEPVAVVNI